MFSEGRFRRVGEGRCGRVGEGRSRRVDDHKFQIGLVEFLQSSAFPHLLEVDSFKKFLDPRMCVFQGRESGGQDDLGPDDF